jgi:hypothetical protein
MNLRGALAQAAFWHQPICLSCGEVGEEGAPTECALCGEPAAMDARVVLSFVTNLDSLDSEEE